MQGPALLPALRDALGKALPVPQLPLAHGARPWRRASPGCPAGPEVRRRAVPGRLLLLRHEAAAPCQGEHRGALARRRGHRLHARAWAGLAAASVPGAGALQTLHRAGQRHRAPLRARHPARQLLGSELRLAPRRVDRSCDLRPQLVCEGVGALALVREQPPHLLAGLAVRSVGGRGLLARGGQLARLEGELLAEAAEVALEREQQTRLVEKPCLHRAQLRLRRRHVRPQAGDHLPQPRLVGLLLRGSGTEPAVQLGTQAPGEGVAALLRVAPSSLRLPEAALQPHRQIHEALAGLLCARRAGLLRGFRPPLRSLLQPGEGGHLLLELSDGLLEAVAPPGSRSHACLSDLAGQPDELQLEPRPQLDACGVGVRKRVVAASLQRLQSVLDHRQLAWRLVLQRC
mmetsp:Transcript_98375/g.267050  ORF Transcript_98375/g.267050 Transcript_98375/m.267050 type:complete len:402 (-) Transcript_98375:269-1474(-)